MIQVQFLYWSVSKIVIEHDQEIPQSRTEDKPVAPRGIAITSTRHHEGKQSKATSSLFTIKMIAKLEL